MSDSSGLLRRPSESAWIPHPLYPSYKLRDWIHRGKILGTFLSLNPHPHAIDLLEEYYLNQPSYEEVIDWQWLSSNACAIHLLEKNQHKIDSQRILTNPKALCIIEQYPKSINYWHYLSRNAHSHTMYLIEDNLNSVEELVEIVKNLNETRAKSNMDPLYIPKDELDWKELSTNPYAIHILEKYQEKIHWCYFSLNTSTFTLRLFNANLNRINWNYLSQNPSTNALRILEANPHKINWSCLSSNPHPRALCLLEENPDKIDWTNLSKNKNERAMQLLEEKIRTNPEMINYNCLSQNPAIFIWDTEYNYTQMKESKQTLHKELIENAFHPKNISKFEDWGFGFGLQNDE